MYADTWYDPMGRGGYGDGGVCSATDLLAWGSYWLTADAGPLALSKAAKQEMVTPSVSTNTPGSFPTALPVPFTTRYLTHVLQMNRVDCHGSFGPLAAPVARI